jgi:hypothetical protein
MVNTDTVKLPGIGPVKKTYALAGGAAVTGILLVSYYRGKKTAANPAVASGEINPVTGFPYGSPQDTAALAIQGAGVPVTGSGGGDGIGDTPPPDIGSGGLPVFANNAMWAQYVEAYMINQEQADPTTVGNAIGAYLTGTPVTENQRIIINRAIAIGERPPVSGQGGFPPSMHVIPALPTPPAPTYKYVIEQHHTGPTPRSGLGLITQLSVAGAPAANLQSALQATVNDTHNARWRTYFSQHGGSFPPNIILTTHVVKKG